MELEIAPFAMASPDTRSAIMSMNTLNTLKDSTELTGQELFTMYVISCLCTGEWRWEELSAEMQNRWNHLAKQLKLNKPVVGE
jgi:hypothetical protein